MSEHGMATAQSSHVGTGGGSPNRVPRIVHPIGSTGILRSSSRLHSMYDLHWSVAGWAVAGNQQNRAADPGSLMEKLVNILLVCGSLYVLVFLALLVL